MIDPRVTELANILVHHSIQAKSGEKVQIKLTSPQGLPLARQVYKELIRIGCLVHVDLGDEQMGSFSFRNAQQHQLEATPEIGLFVANWIEKTITIVADDNTRELAGVPKENLALRAKTIKPVRDIAIEKPWVLVYFPTTAMAQDAGMGLEEFENFFFEACNRDWSVDKGRLETISQYLNNISNLEIIGQHTHLNMSTKDRLWIPCYGTHNMPDGEVFTAPVENSVEGHVFFEYPLLRQGKLIRDIQLWFEKGRVIKVVATENQDVLEGMLDTDEGARMLGEVAIGTNPMIQQYMFNTLFDEKMAGTVHMALGEAYSECKGVNKSAIHVDIVKNMRSEGSTILADGKEIYKEGVFTGPLG